MYYVTKGRQEIEFLNTCSRNYKKNLKSNLLAYFYCKRYLRDTYVSTRLIIVINLQKPQLQNYISYFRRNLGTCIM